jgi:chaperone required for assembly of F1-ATPase
MRSDEARSPSGRGLFPAGRLGAAKRSYTSVEVETLGEEGCGILLDGRWAATPREALLAVPSAALATAIACEWRAQQGTIDPATMPLTQLANTAIDGVAGHETEVRADILKYSASDLLCYRAQGPRALALRQAEAWDPVLTWAAEVLKARFSVSAGLMPIAQPPAAIRALAAALEPYRTFELAALHVMTTLMGSALLALAHAQRRLDLKTAWKAAHVDEDWQIAQWGEDLEARARRERRRREMEAASRLLALAAQA